MIESKPVHAFFSMDLSSFPNTDFVCEPFRPVELFECIEKGERRCDTEQLYRIFF